MAIPIGKIGTEEITASKLLEGTSFFPEGLDAIKFLINELNSESEFHPIQMLTKEKFKSLEGVDEVKYTQENFSWIAQNKEKKLISLLIENYIEGKKDSLIEALDIHEIDLLNIFVRFYGIQFYGNQDWSKYRSENYKLDYETGFKRFKHP